MKWKKDLDWYITVFGIALFILMILLIIFSNPYNTTG